MDILEQPDSKAVQYSNLEETKSNNVFIVQWYYISYISISYIS